MISKWFFASFRTLSFVFLYGDQEPSSWGRSNFKRPPPPPAGGGKSRGPAGRGLSIDSLEAMRYFFFVKVTKWPVELAESFDIQFRYKDNLEQGGIVHLKGPSHRGKSCYIRGGCVPRKKFDATDYESTFRFSENCLVLDKSSFELLNNFCLRDVILTSFKIPSHYYQISRQLLRP